MIVCMGQQKKKEKSPKVERLCEFANLYLIKSNKLIQFNDIHDFSGGWSQVWAGLGF